MNGLELVKAGYRRYEPNSILNPSANAHYQKKIDGNFFINIYEYTVQEIGIMFQGAGQFEANGNTFNVELLYVQSIEQAENFYRNVFTSLNCEASV